MKITLLFLFRLFFHPNLSRHSYTAQYICVSNNYCANSRGSSGWITTCCGLASTRTHNTATTSRSTRKWWQLCWNFSGNNSYWYCISRQYYSYHVTKEKELRSFVTRTLNLFFEADRPVHLRHRRKKMPWRYTWGPNTPPIATLFYL